MSKLFAVSLESSWHAFVEELFVFLLFHCVKADHPVYSGLEGEHTGKVFAL